MYTYFNLFLLWFLIFWHVPIKTNKKQNKTKAEKATAYCLIRTMSLESFSRSLFLFGPGTSLLKNMQVNLF